MAISVKPLVGNTEGRPRLGGEPVETTRQTSVIGDNRSHNLTGWVQLLAPQQINPASRERLGVFLSISNTGSRNGIRTHDLGVMNAVL